jgi:hypothetical protein
MVGQSCNRSFVYELPMTVTCWCQLKLMDTCDPYMQSYPKSGLVRSHFQSKLVRSTIGPIWNYYLYRSKYYKAKGGTQEKAENRIDHNIWIASGIPPPSMVRMQTNIHYFLMFYIQLHEGENWLHSIVFRVWLIGLTKTWQLIHLYLAYGHGCHIFLTAYVNLVRDYRRKLMSTSQLEQEPTRVMYDTQKKKTDSWMASPICFWWEITVMGEPMCLV